MKQERVTERNQKAQQNTTQHTAKSQSVYRRHDYLYWQAQGIIGNHGVLRRCGSDVIQAKLTIGSPKDKYEQEADQVADRLIVMSGPITKHMKIGSEFLSPASSVQKKETGSILSSTDNATPQIIKNMVNSGGQPLDPSSRTFMESRFGYNLSQVRIHTDSRPSEWARALKARAFTVGQDVVFARGQYAPGTIAGKRLLAHELVHTIQQKSQGRRFRTQRALTIMRTPETAGLEPPRLFGSEIPKPVVTRFDSKIFATVYFGQNHFLMDLLNFRVVEKLSEEMSFMFEPTVVVDGHASTEGTGKYNLELSEKRRQAAIAILRSKVVGKLKISGKAYGESKPVVEETGKTPADLESQRRNNRRVEILILPISAVAPPKPKKPLKLIPTLEPETPEERLERIIKEPLPKPPRRRSLSEMIQNKLDEAVEDICRKAGVPSKYRGLIKKGARSLAKGAAEKVLDTALDQTGLSSKEKKAIKAAIKATVQMEVF